MNRIISFVLLAASMFMFSATASATGYWWTWFRPIVNCPAPAKEIDYGKPEARPAYLVVLETSDGEVVNYVIDNINAQVPAGTNLNQFYGNEMDAWIKLGVESVCAEDNEVASCTMVDFEMMAPAPVVNSVPEPLVPDYVK